MSPNITHILGLHKFILLTKAQYPRSNKVKYVTKQYYNNDHDDIFFIFYHNVHLF